MKSNMLPVYTVMHFLIDLSCIFYLMGMIYVRLPGASARVTAAVLYNAMAFAFPMALGLLADRIGHNSLVSCSGCLLILSAYLWIPAPWAAVILIGTGNGLFHIGAGRQVLLDSSDANLPAGRRLRFGPSGIFIGSGALGVYLGRILAGEFRQLVYRLMWSALVLCVLVLAYQGIRHRREQKGSRIRAQQIRAAGLFSSLLLFAVVVLRSYYGFVAVYSWNRGFAAGLIFTFCIAAGKMAGGIIADRVGVNTASVISLAGAGILALFGDKSPAAGCISILLFNMTMPVTLTLLAELWRELPGFAFGTLMMALFLGTLPSMVWHAAWLASPAGQLGLCLISLLLLQAVCRIPRRKPAG